MHTNENIINILREIAKTKTIKPESLKHLSPEAQELIRNLHEDNLVQEALEFSESLNVNENWDKLKLTLTEKETTVTPLWQKAFKYAAILVVLLGLLFVFKQQFAPNESPTQVATDAIELLLEDGSVKTLDSNGNYKIADAQGKVIVNQKDDVLNYNSTSESQKLVYNQLKVPYGKTFNIVLSDGTKVYLNSGTSLKYPVHFINGKNREVFLDGEAYFEVSKDKNHPFIVNANNMNIKVLGTQFNVSSYSDEDETNTVLVEGSVSLTNENSNAPTLLKPGFKGYINKNNPTSIEIEEVDTKIYTEWMNGDVIFRNSIFKDMVKKLARNYNVTIENHYESLNQKRFNASFNRKIESIDDIMVAISEIYPFTYSKTENKIIINP
ncbi:FecR family protein [Flavobacteriaceae bacterium GSB9]|nr:FecR family protein [Flavobacteriaceae bacterium GSB9]